MQCEHQHSDRNGDDDNGDGDSGNNKDKDNYVGSSGEHCRLTSMAMEWMRMVRAQKLSIERLNIYCYIICHHNL